MKFEMKGNVSGHYFGIEGEGKGLPYELVQERPQRIISLQCITIYFNHRVEYDHAAVVKSGSDITVLMIF